MVNSTGSNTVRNRPTTNGTYFSLKLHPVLMELPTVTHDEMISSSYWTPITLYGDLILDGVDKLAACHHRALQPVFRQWNGQNGTPTQYILAQRKAYLATLSKTALAVIGSYACKQIKLERQDKNVERHVGPCSQDAIARTLGINADLISAVNNLDADQVDILRRGEASVSTFYDRVSRTRSKRPVPSADRVDKAAIIASISQVAAATKYCPVEYLSDFSRNELDDILSKLSTIISNTRKFRSQVKGLNNAATTAQ